MATQRLATLQCKTHGELFPHPHGPVCWKCALAEIKTADQFRSFCRSVRDKGPHHVPAWGEWAALAKDGVVVSHPDLEQLKTELYDRNLFLSHGLLKAPVPGAEIR